MRIRSLVTVGVVAALAVACKQETKYAGGSADPGNGTVGSAAGSAAPTTAGSATPTTTAPADSVTLKYSVDPVGSRWTETSAKRLVLDIEASGQKIAMIQEDAKTKQTEVLAASDVAVTKAKITFVDVAAKQTTGDKAQDKPTPHKGKAYLIEAEPSGAVKVTAPDGAPVSAAEEAAVKDDARNFGKPEKMGKALDGMTFERGKRVEIPAERATGAFGDNDKMTVDKLALTLTKVEGSEAWFDLEMVASGAAGKGMVMKMNFKGPLHIDLAIARPIDLSLEGTVEMTGSARATGTMMMSGTRTKG